MLVFFMFFFEPFPKLHLPSKLFVPESRYLILLSKVSSYHTHIYQPIRHGRECGRWCWRIRNVRFILLDKRRPHNLGWISLLVWLNCQKTLLKESSFDRKLLWWPFYIYIKAHMYTFSHFNKKDQKESGEGEKSRK